MKIADVICAVGVSCYFHMDHAAILGGAKSNGFIYEGEPRTPGFARIVQPADVISVLLVLEDGQVAFGDCADVAFAGTAGRDPPFVASQHLDLLRGEIADRFRGRDLSVGFRALADEVDNLVPQAGHCLAGARLHTALRYGLSQAFLHAAALGRRRTLAEVVSEEYGTEVASHPIPLAVACELDDLRQLDRMILKQVEILPHVFFTDIERQIGQRGEKFAEYVGYVAKRIDEIGDDAYSPRLRFDMCGLLGEVFNHDIDALAGYLARVSEKAPSFEILIEAPIIGPNKTEHIERFRALRERLRRNGSSIRLVADEWCNTFEDVIAFTQAEASDFVHVKMPDLGGINNSIAAVLHCKERGMGVCLGGSANETDQSARISANIALACEPDFMQSKPGLGGDEGLMIERNEMARTLALVAHRRRASDA